MKSPLLEWSALGHPGKTAMTIAAATAGGALFAWLSVPAAWLTGAMLAVAILALAKLPTELPSGLRDMSAIVVGTSTGSGLTPDSFGQISLWLQSLSLLMISTVLSMAASSFYLRKVHKWDATTASYGSVPGAVSAVMTHAMEDNADVPRIAIAQIVRQWVVIAAIAIGLLFSGGEASQHTADGAATPASILLLSIFLSAAGAIALRLVWASAGLVLGSMVISAILHGTGLVSGRLPISLVSIAFVFIGAAIGCRFAGLSWRFLTANLIPALGSALIAVIISLAFAFLGSELFGRSFVTFWLAYAPGAVEVMLSLAFALGADMAFVAVHHATRLIILNLASPFWARKSDA